MQLAARLAVVRTRAAMTRRQLALVGLVAVAAIALTLFGLSWQGGLGTDRIADILANPTRFEKRTLHLSGICRGSVGVLEHGAFQLDDGTGQIVVLRRKSIIPAEGEQVVVTGSLAQVAKIGDFNGLYIDEEPRPQ